MERCARKAPWEHWGVAALAWGPFCTQGLLSSVHRSSALKPNNRCRLREACSSPFVNILLPAQFQDPFIS